MGRTKGAVEGQCKNSEADLGENGIKGIRGRKLEEGIEEVAMNRVMNTMSPVVLSHIVRTFVLSADTGKGCRNQQQEVHTPDDRGTPKKGKERVCI